MADFITFSVLIDTLGYIGLALGILSFQFKGGKSMLAVQAFMNIFWAAHYWFLGAYVGALMGMIALFRNGLGCAVSKTLLPVVVILSSFASICCGLYVATSWIYLSACAGNILNTCSILARDKPSAFRCIQFAGEIMWLTYSVIVLSWPGIFFGIFLISSNIVGTIRHEPETIKKLYSALTALTASLNSKVFR